jgi:hypothetical protein
VDAGVRFDLAVNELAAEVALGGLIEDVVRAAGELHGLGVGEP